MVGVGSTSATAILSEANQTYSAVATTATGSGEGATLTISRDATGGISTVTVVEDGRYYKSGDVITVSYVSIGGTSTSDNLTLTVTSAKDAVTINTASDW